MKISGSPEPLRSERALSRTTDARTSAAAGDAGGTEKVEVSDLAAKMAQLESRFGGDFDAKKVEEVRSAIAEGRFTIDAGAVADRLVASANELLGRQA